MEKILAESKNDIEFQNIIRELIENDTVKSMEKYNQHCDTNCFEHCYHVSYICYKVCKKLKLDYKAAARAGMLHDLFLYNWRENQEDIKGLHAFTHGNTACKNASKLFDLSDKEKDMIKTHMFPVTIIPPKSREGFILTIVDKYCTVAELNEYLFVNFALLRTNLGVI